MGVALKMRRDFFKQALIPLSEILALLIFLTKLSVYQTSQGLYYLQPHILDQYNNLLYGLDARL